MRNLFDAVAASGDLEPIDLHFGRLLLRRAEAGEAADVVALTGALLSHERSRGHSCVDPGWWAGRPFPADGPAPLPSLPDLATWERALSGSRLVGDGGGPTPLVRDGAGRLYLSRYWRAEQRLARRLRRRLAAARPAVDAAALAPLFRRLFPPADDAVDWQAVAAAAALASPVALVSGGPGTGKTTTVARILALLAADDPGIRVSLAAPTGKAAARLGEAIASQISGLAIDDELRARIPTSASTIHRLLGYQPRHDRFRHDARRPLVCDALVIDEASMVDLLMMDALVDALPRRARVILLGDKDQLASVETGFVFGDLCAAAGADGTFSPGFGDLYRRLAGREVPIGGAGGLLADAAVELRRSYRFDGQPGIGELAAAVRAGDAHQALRTLADPDLDDVRQIDPPAIQDDALEPLLQALDAYLTAPGAAAALERLGGFRILCARRQGAWGLEPMNAAVERHLARQGRAVGERFYPGRPILVTANDYQVRLFNGDLGVCWPDAGRLWAFFPGTGGELRRLPLAKLPPHDTAWAMTVHKSQGSEFDQVLLVLGDADSRVMTRELLYTGITRARRQVVLLGTPEVIRGAVGRASQRTSGLVDALRADGAEPDGTETPPAPATPDPAASVSAADVEEAPDAEPSQLSLF